MAKISSLKNPTRFDHRGQRTLVVVLKGLTASKSQAAGKQVDGKNS